MGKKVKFGIAFSIIFLALGYLIFMATKSAGMYYLTLPELRAQAEEFRGKVVRLNGMIVSDSVVKDPSDEFSMIFELTDEKGRERPLKVFYKGVPPDLMHKDGVTLIAEGTYNEKDDTFMAKELLVKCPSKYESKSKERIDG